MMTLSEIKSFYPVALQSKGAFLLREYLQYKILSLLFESEYANKFAFLGGTCLRIVHNNQRFSEDLDFDNFNLTQKDFEQVAAIIQQGLEKEGYEVTLRNVFKSAFHCYVRFPGLLFKEGLSAHKEAKILINLDTEPQHFEFELQSDFLNKFDVFTTIKTTPLDILLSQKFTALTQRKRPKGRDFFDVVFLLSKTKPNYDFLKHSLDISDAKQLRAYILERCKAYDLKALAKDVQPFLFQSTAVNRVLQFEQYIQNANL